MTGAAIVIDTLLREGADVVFGYPGGKVIPIFDLINKSDRLRFVLTRHEQAAAHAADGYARATGKVGVCLVTSGPGATNTITGIATAKSDSIPVVFISGQVSTAEIGSDAFQEADVAGLARPICKHNYTVMSIQELPQVLKDAFHLARTGRPGPVAVDLPVDVSTALLDPYVYPGSPGRPAREPRAAGRSERMKKLVEAVNRAEKPLVLAGGGIISSGAGEELSRFLRKTNIPAAMTLMGLGCLPKDMPLNLGMAGMHGMPAANLAIMECDLLIGIGTRFDDRITSDPKAFAPKALIAHVDIDAAEIGKHVHTDIPIVGDARAVLAELTEKLDPRPAGTWNAKLGEWNERYALRYKQEPEGRILPQSVIDAVNEAAAPGTIFVTDVGQNQMWAALLLKHGGPRSFISSGGMGTMGFGLPAAMGARLGCPDRPVICISGDGGIQMNIQELATCSLNRIPVKIVVMNNSCLGMVRQWQELYWNANYSKTCLKENAGCGENCRESEGLCQNAYWPDLVGVARANGMPGLRAEKPSEILPVLKEGLAMKGPVLMEFMVDKYANIFPMVSLGKPLNHIIFGRT